MVGVDVSGEDFSSGEKGLNGGELLFEKKSLNNDNSGVLLLSKALSHIEQRAVWLYYL